MANKWSRKSQQIDEKQMMQLFEMVWNTVWSWKNFEWIILVIEMTEKDFDWMMPRLCEVHIMKQLAAVI